MESAELELQVEDLEPIIAPGISPNHNETFLATAELGAELSA